MKKKVLISFLAILLILTLVGCWQYPGYDPYWVPEDDIIELVNYYWCCISEGWYWCAQNLCCLPYGDAWYQVEEYQNTPYPEGTVITYDPYYNWIHIDGDEAIANIDLVITTCLEDVCSTEIIHNYSIYLIKLLIGILNKINGMDKEFEKFSILYQRFGKDQTGYLLL